MKPIMTLILMLAATVGVHAQLANPITIDVKLGGTGRIEFHAHNASPMPIVVVLDFPILFNYDPSARVPYRFNVPSTPRRVFDLRIRNSVNSSDYKYNYAIYTGCVNTKPTDIEYLLPVPDGVGVVASRSAFYGAAGETVPPANWYAVRFTIDGGNTVTAARKARVLEVDENSLLVSHADCTFARYRGFEPGGIRVRVSDTVLPGDVMGTVPMPLTGEGASIGMIVYFRDDRSLVPFGETYTGHSWIYVTPEFRTASARNMVFETGTAAIATHPEELVTKEMTRAERRRRGN